MWESLADALLLFLQEWGEIAIFVIFLLEESGVPLPLPGDLALIWAGYHVASGQSRFIVVLLVVELATLIGASTLYWLGLRGGRPLIVRRSEEHTSELQSQSNLVCRLLLEKKKEQRNK